MTLERSTSVYREVRDYRILDKSYATEQFFRMYCARLAYLRELAVENARRTWASRDYDLVAKVPDVATGRDSVISGVLYCHMPGKPNVLEEVLEHRSIRLRHSDTPYTSEADVFYLEDDSGRIKLTGDRLKREPLLSVGVVAAVYGVQSIPGEFEVSDICFSTVASQVPRLAPGPGPGNYVLLTSGWNVGATGADGVKPASPASLRLLADLVSGQLGSPELIQQMARVTRVIIAGNALAKSSSYFNLQQPTQYQTAQRADDFTRELDEFDQILALLAGNVHVDVMSGEGDPAPQDLPQPPMHRFLFHRAKQLQSFTPTTNPYCFSLDGVEILGVSGQTINDVRRYGRREDEHADPFLALERTLVWRHLAPTCPDTLSCYPMKDDLLCLEQTPHVYFAGNQREFGTRCVTLAEGIEVRLILVPSFAETGQVALLNLATLECTSITISVT